MKLILVVLGFTTMVISCGQKIYSEKTEPCTTSVTGDTIVLAYQKPVRVFQKCYDNLNASITTISDSRCPKGVQCIWAGKVSVVLQLDNNFNIILEPGKQIDTSYNQKKFSFTLLDVLPYPEANNPNFIADYKLVVKIIKN